MRLWVPNIRPWPLTRGYANSRRALKATPEGRKAVLKARSENSVWVRASLRQTTRPNIGHPQGRSDELDSAMFLRAHTDRATKVTVPDPFTSSQLAQNDYYPDQRSLALASAAALNEELMDLEAVGIDVLQVDEPYLQAMRSVCRAECPTRA